LLPGCSPPGTDETALQSRFFRAVQIIGTRGTALGQFNKPRSVAVDRQDNLYVVDMTARVQKFSPQGALLGSWQMTETDLGKPKGMCLDGCGHLVVLEPHYSRVNHFTPEGRLVRQWGVHGTNDGELAFPRAIAVNSKAEMFISEYGRRERVQCFAEPGPKFVRVMGRAGDGPGEFNRPEGLGLDAADRLYVADSCNHRIQVFTAEGRWLRAYGRPGSGPGQLSYPYDVRVDAQGHQFVCEFGNSRIQVFDPRDQAVEIIGGPGAGPGQFDNPWSLALDSQGNLYVADTGNHRVQKLIRKNAERRGGERGALERGALERWSGRAWSGGVWSGRAWSGRAWSGRAWSGGAWSGRAWSGRAWSGRAWSVEFRPRSTLLTLHAPYGPPSASLD
jgi:sugar lactone lactonase YvrE